MNAIQEVVNDDGCQAAFKNLQLHIRMFYGAADENSITNDEMRLEQLKSMVREMAGKDTITSRARISSPYQKSLLKSKRSLQKKTAGRDRCGSNQNGRGAGSPQCPKNHLIDFDDTAARQLINCIKVVSKTKLLVIFKGEIKKTATMEYSFYAV